VILFSGWIDNITIPANSMATFDERKDAIWDTSASTITTTTTSIHTTSMNGASNTSQSWLLILFSLCFLWLNPW